MKKGNFKVNAIKTVVDEVQDSRLEVSLKDALEINRAYEVGDEIRFEVTPKDFGRLAAQTAKQVIMQRLREAERERISLVSILNIRMKLLLVQLKDVIIACLRKDW